MSEAMRNMIALGSLLLALAWATPAAALSDSGLNGTEMEEMVVTATRFERQKEKIPAHVSILDEQDIERSGADSVPDVLQRLGGVVVRDLNGNGINQSVDMGGFGETADRHVAVVVNGRRINAVDQRGTSWSTIPLENIKRIEVLHGGASVLYGDNAMGGVINIITKKGREGVRAEAEASAGSFDTRKGTVSLNVGREDMRLYLGFDGSRSDGYRERSASDRSSFYGTLSGNVGPNLSAFLEATVSQADFELPGALTQAQRDRDREQSVNPEDDGSDEKSSLVLGASSNLGGAGTASCRASYRNLERESHIASWSSFMEFDVETVGLTPQYVLDAPLAGHSNRLTLGFDYYGTDYQARRGSGKSSLDQRFEHTKTTYSLFAQNELDILEHLVWNVGARYQDTDFDLSADGAGRETGDPEWAWSTGLAYAFREGSKLYIRAYQAFRYPAVDEYVSMFTGQVNEDLEHETQIGYETGLRYTRPEPDMTVSLRAYLFQVRDEISYNTATRRNENIQETRHAGGEVDLRYSPHRLLTLFGAAGYTDAELRKGEFKGNTIPLVPEWKARAGLELGRYKGFLARIGYNYVGERFFGNDRANENGKMQGFSTVSAHISHTWSNVELFLTARNIFSEKYSDYGFASVDVTTGKTVLNFYPKPEAEYLAGIRLEI
jgi:iron complex outermembrane receptor protein